MDDLSQLHLKTGQDNIRRPEGFLPTALIKTKQHYRSVPDICLYPPLYKGRRYRVFEDNVDQPYRGFYDVPLLLLDCLTGKILASGTQKANGSIDACVLWGQGVTFSAFNPRDMIDQTLSITKWYC